MHDRISTGDQIIVKRGPMREKLGAVQAIGNGKIVFRSSGQTYTVHIYDVRRLHTSNIWSTGAKHHAVGKRVQIMPRADGKVQPYKGYYGDVTAHNAIKNLFHVQIAGKAPQEYSPSELCYRIIK